MKTGRARIVFIGLTITSSWGNGHATTYRGLVRELARRRHDVLFLERDVPWYASNRDLPQPPYGRTALYASVAELKDRFARDVARADLVVVGSYVPDGIAVGDWVCGAARGVTAFYDIDTPVTLAALEAGTCTYLTPALIRRYDLYLSFTGGPTLDRLERDLGARMARPLYCSFDPAAYHPERRAASWDLGYMGTHCPSRDPGLRRLLIDAARRQPESRFIVAGPGYEAREWPTNVEYVTHVAACDHRAFYTSQRFTLNLTRGDMIRAGYSPSVRLFEAAACGVPIISDSWPGLDAFFVLDREILISTSAAETLEMLGMSERERVAIGRRARRRVLGDHTAEHRAIQLEEYLEEASRRGSVRAPVVLPASAGAAPPVS
ncbi:MAG TPA: glycosyltransferase [Vicinamibacterales bacterium]|nr:glycosyltransferase [Vicinamibacterales bacterium]